MTGNAPWLPITLPLTLIAGRYPAEQQAAVPYLSLCNRESIGSLPIDVTLNTFNGEVCVKLSYQIDSLLGSRDLGMIYSTHQGWTLAIASPGLVDGGQFLELHHHSGRPLSFAWQQQHNAFVAPPGSTPCDAQIVKTAAGYTWYSPQTGEYQRFNHRGQLIEQHNAQGQTLTLSYNDMRITAISTGHQHRYHFHWQNRQCQVSLESIDDNSITPLITYQFADDNCCTLIGMSLYHPLKPYNIEISYPNDKQCLIKQADNSQLLITQNDQQQCQSLIFGDEGYQIECRYQQYQSIISLACGSQLLIDHLTDGVWQHIALQQSQQQASYTIDYQWQQQRLQKIIASNGHHQYFHYDQQQRLIEHHIFIADRSVCCRKYDYHPHGYLQQLTQSDPNNQLSTNYCYQQQGNQRFVMFEINSHGHVKQYHYQNDVISCITDYEACYQGEINLFSLQQWVSQSLQQQRCCHIHQLINEYGQRSQSYKCGGTDPTQSQQQLWRYTHQGKLLVHSQQGMIATIITRDDPLGRVTRHCDPNGAISDYLYDYQQCHITTISHSNGSTQKKWSNTIGKPTRIDKVNNDDQVRTHYLFYDNAGNLLCEKTKDQQWYFYSYNQLGQQIVSIDPIGHCQVTDYWPSNDVIHTCQRATTVDLSQILDNKTVGGIANQWLMTHTAVTNHCLYQLQHNDDRHRYQLNQTDRQLLVAADGGVKETIRDSLGQTISERHFATAYSQQLIKEILTAGGQFTTNRNDRHLINLYRGKNKRLVKDAENYISYFHYNSYGHMTASYQFINQINDQQWQRLLDHIYSNQDGNIAIESLQSIITSSDVWEIIEEPDSSTPVSQPIAITVWQYNPLQQITKISEPENRKITYAWHSSAKIASKTESGIKDDSSRCQTFDYDQALRLSTRIDHQHHLTEVFEYDSYNNMVSHRQSDRKSIHHRYSHFVFNEDQQLIAYQSPLMAEHSSKVAKDSTGYLERYQRHSSGVMIRKITADNHVIDYAYDACHRLIAQQSATGSVHIFKRNSFGDIQQALYIDQAMPSDWLSSFGPIVDRMLISRIIDEQAISYQLTQYEHDKCGRIIKTITSDGKATLNQWNVFGELIEKKVHTLQSPDQGFVQRYDYDHRGLLINQQWLSANGIIHQEIKQRFDNPYRKCNSRQLNQDIPILLTYDLAGRLIKRWQTWVDPLTHQKQTIIHHQYYYDSLSRIIRIYQRDKTTIDLRYQDLTQHIYHNSVWQGAEIYNAFGQVIRRLDYHGSDKQFSYDADNQVTKLVKEMADLDSQLKEYREYNLSGKLVEHYSDQFHHRLFYDGDQRLVESESNFSQLGVNHSHHYHCDYNAHHLMTHKQYDDSNSDNYCYDSRGNWVVRTSCDNQIPQTRITKKTYDHLNQPTKIHHSDPLNSIGFLTTQKFNTLGQLMTRTVDPEELNISTHNQYFQHGKVVYQKDGEGHIQVICYDELHRKRIIIDRNNYVSYRAFNEANQLCFVIEYNQPCDPIFKLTIHQYTPAYVHVWQHMQSRRCYSDRYIANQWHQNQKPQTILKAYIDPSSSVWHLLMKIYHYNDYHQAIYGEQRLINTHQPVTADVTSILQEPNNPSYEAMTLCQYVMLYNSRHQVTISVNPQGYVTRNTYNHYSQLQSKHRFHHPITAIQRDTLVAYIKSTQQHDRAHILAILGQEYEFTSIAQERDDYVHWPNGYPLCHIDGKGMVTHYHHDSRWRLIRLQRHQRAVNWHERIDRSTLEAILIEHYLKVELSQHDTVIENQYNHWGELISSQLNQQAPNHYRRNATGRIEQHINLLGGVTDYQYDGAKRLIAEIRRDAPCIKIDVKHNTLSHCLQANDSGKHYQYDNNHRITKEYYRHTTSDEGVSYLYDGQGQTISKSQMLDCDNGSKTPRKLTLFPSTRRLCTDSFVHNRHGKVVIHTNALGQSHYYGYHPQGYQLFDIRDDGRATYFQYDGLGQCIYQRQLSCRYPHDLRKIADSSFSTNQILKQLYALHTEQDITKQYHYHPYQQYLSATTHSQQWYYEANTQRFVQHAVTIKQATDRQQRVLWIEEPIDEKRSRCHYYWYQSGIDGPIAEANNIYQNIDQCDRQFIITHYRYNTLGQMTERRRYINPIPLKTYLPWSDIQTQLCPHQNDIIEFYRYTQQGKLASHTYHQRRFHHLINQQPEIIRTDATTTYCYDASGHRISTTRANGDQQHDVFDSHGRKIQQLDWSIITSDNQQTRAVYPLQTFYYDVYGHLIVTIDDLDGADVKQLQTTTLPHESKPGQITRYLKDPQGRLLFYQKGKLATGYTYDPLGRRSRQWVLHYKNIEHTAFSIDEKRWIYQSSKQWTAEHIYRDNQRISALSRYRRYDAFDRLVDTSQSDPKLSAGQRRYQSLSPWLITNVNGIYQLVFYHYDGSPSLIVESADVDLKAINSVEEAIRRLSTSSSLHTYLRDEIISNHQGKSLCRFRPPSINLTPIISQHLTIKAILDPTQLPLTLTWVSTPSSEHYRVYMRCSPDAKPIALGQQDHQVSVPLSLLPTSTPTIDIFYLDPQHVQDESIIAGCQAVYACQLLGPFNHTPWYTLPIDQYKCFSIAIHMCLTLWGNNNTLVLKTETDMTECFKQATLAFLISTPGMNKPMAHAEFNLTYQRPGYLVGHGIWPMPNLIAQIYSDVSLQLSNGQHLPLFQQIQFKVDPQDSTCWQIAKHDFNWLTPPTAYIDGKHLFRSDRTAVTAKAVSQSKKTVGWIIPSRQLPVSISEPTITYVTNEVIPKLWPSQQQPPRSNRLETMRYDSLGRLVYQQDVMGRVTRFDYLDQPIFATRYQQTCQRWVAQPSTNPPQYKLMTVQSTFRQALDIDGRVFFEQQGFSTSNATTQWQAATTIKYMASGAVFTRQIDDRCQFRQTHNPLRQIQLLFLNHQQWRFSYEDDRLTQLQQMDGQRRCFHFGYDGSDTLLCRLQIGSNTDKQVHWRHDPLGHISQLQLPQGQQESQQSNTNGNVIQRQTNLGWVKYQRHLLTNLITEQVDSGGSRTVIGYNYRGQRTEYRQVSWGDRGRKGLHQHRIRITHPDDPHQTLSRITTLPLSHQVFYYTIDWLSESRDVALNTHTVYTFNRAGEICSTARYDHGQLRQVIHNQRDSDGLVVYESIGRSSQHTIKRQLCWDPFDNLVRQQLVLNSDDGHQYQQSLAYSYDQFQQLTYHACDSHWLSSDTFQLTIPSPLMGGKCDYQEDGQLSREDLKDQSLSYRFDGSEVTSIKDSETHTFHYDEFKQINRIVVDGKARYDYQTDANGVQRRYLNHLQSLEDNHVELTTDGLHVTLTHSSDRHQRSAIRQNFRHSYASENTQALLVDWAGQAEDLVHHQHGLVKTSYLYWRDNQISAVIIGDPGDRKKPRAAQQMTLSEWADHDHIYRLSVIDGPLATIEGREQTITLPFNLVITYHLVLDSQGQIVASITTSPIHPRQWVTAPTGEHSALEPHYLGGRFQGEWLISPVIPTLGNLHELYGNPLADIVYSEYQRTTLNALPTSDQRHYQSCLQLSDPINAMTIRQAAVQPISWDLLTQPLASHDLGDLAIEPVLCHALQQIFQHRPLPGGMRLPVKQTPCREIKPSTAFPLPLPVNKALTITPPNVSLNDNISLEDEHDPLIALFIDTFISAVIAVLAPTGLAMLGQFRQSLWIGIRTTAMEFTFKRVAHAMHLIPGQTWQDAIQQGLNQTLARGIPLLRHVSPLNHIPPLLQHISQSLLLNIGGQSVNHLLGQQHGWQKQQMLEAVIEGVTHYAINQHHHFKSPIAHQFEHDLAEIGIRAFVGEVNGHGIDAAMLTMHELGRISGHGVATQLVNHYHDYHAANDHHYHGALLAARGIDNHYAGNEWFVQLDHWLKQQLTLDVSESQYGIPPASEHSYTTTPFSTDKTSAATSLHHYGLFARSQIPSIPSFTSTTGEETTNANTVRTSTRHHLWSAILDLSQHAGHYAYLALKRSAMFAFDLSPIGTTLNSYNGLRYGYDIHHHPMSSWQITENVAGTIAWSVPAIAIAERSWHTVRLGEQLTISSLASHVLPTTPIAKRYLEESMFNAIASAYGAVAAGGSFVDIRQAAELGVLNGLLFGTPAFRANAVLSNIYFQSAATSLVGQAVTKFHHPQAHWSPLSIGFSMVGAGAAEQLTRDINVEFYKMMAAAKITVPIDAVGSHIASEHHI